MKYLLFLIVLCLVLQASAQDDGVQSWAKFTSPKGNLTFQLPVGFLVNNENPVCELFYYQGEVALTFSRGRVTDPKGYLKTQIRSAELASGKKLSRIEKGDFIATSFVDTKDRYRIEFRLASGREYYEIAAAAKTSADPTLERFLKSIRIDGDPLLKDAVVPDVPGIAARVDEVETSPEVKAALKVPNARNPVIRRARPGDVSVQEDEKIAYSRPVIFLDRSLNGTLWHAPPPNRRGVVRLKVQFRADGRIGEIVVFEDPGGLVETFLQGVKRVKFLPAQRSGQPIDVYVYYEHTYR